MAQGSNRARGSGGATAPGGSTVAGGGPFDASVDATFTEQTRRVMARRVPLAVLCFMGIVTLAGLMEVGYYPARLPAFGVSLFLELLVCTALFLASRSLRLRPWLVALASAASVGVTFCMTGYAISTGASADALAFAFIVFLTGAALLYPWGARGQVPFVIAVVAAYLVALGAGLRGGLPLAYPLSAIVGGAVTSIMGAIFLEMHRRAIVRQSLQLEQSRDLQLGMLYDVSRTVTATLELHEVLRLVCQSVLGALGVERLWLIWRESSDGELNGLVASRSGGDARVTALDGDPRRWEALLGDGVAGRPVVRPGTDDERTVLGPAAAGAARLLRLPLEFHGELVGVILTELSDRERSLSDSFLDFAATLGNTAAIAIGHARLHALLLHRSDEMKRLSSQGLAMVEDVLRRLSHELHDNTCQVLMSIKLDLTVLERRFGRESVPLRSAVDDVRQRVMHVMQDVRQLSHLLYPPVLDDFGAVAAIESMVVKVNEAETLRIVLECTDPDARFAPSVELLLFRVFQEAFTNVLKHADAARVVVRIVPEDGVVRLEVEDDGRGFDAPAYFRRPPPSAGLGLLGMRERVGHQGGSLEVVSHLGGGTRIVVRVPAQPLAVGRAAV